MFYLTQWIPDLIKVYSDTIMVENLLCASSIASYILMLCLNRYGGIILIIDSAGEGTTAAEDCIIILLLVYVSVDSL